MQQGSHLICLSRVPVEYSHETLLELHEANELDPLTLVSSEFQPAGAKLATTSVILRYSSPESAAAAEELLEGQPVATRSGGTAYLGAKMMPDEQPPSTPAGPRHVPPQIIRAFAGGPPPPPPPPPGDWVDEPPGDWGHEAAWGSSAGVASKPFLRPAASRAKGSGGEDVMGDIMDSIYPTVHLSQVPIEYSQEDMQELHDACGLDPSTLLEMELLDPTEASADTRCVMLRYADEFVAEVAFEMLQGRSVSAHSGQKLLQAKLTKPPAASAEVEVGPDAGVSDKSLEVDLCAMEAKCLGLAGEPIYEDVTTGDAICEACWERYYPTAGVAEYSMSGQTIFDSRLH